MTPAARIIIDGRDVTTNLFGQGGPLVSLTITDEAGVKSDTLELELDDREGFKAPPIGAEIQAWLGYEPAPVYMGKFKVDEWTKSGSPRMLRVSAKAAELTTAIRAAKSRSFNKKKAGEIVKKVAGDHGLSATVSSDLESIEIDHIDQQNESDLGFLSRLAKRVGATFKLADGKVIFTAKGSDSLPSGKTKPTVTLKESDVTSWSFTRQDRGGGYKAVSCSYMDHGAGERVSVTSGSGKPKHRDRRLYATKAEAEASAKAQIGDLGRGKHQGDVDMPGRTDVFAEGKIVLDFGDPDLVGDHLIKSVTHTFTASGFTTRASFETKEAKGADTGTASDD